MLIRRKFVTNSSGCCYIMFGVFPEQDIPEELAAKYDYGTGTEIRIQYMEDEGYFIAFKDSIISVDDCDGFQYVDGQFETNTTKMVETIKTFCRENNIEFDKFKIGWHAGIVAC